MRAADVVRGRYVATLARASIPLVSTMPDNIQVYVKTWTQRPEPATLKDTHARHRRQARRGADVIRCPADCNGDASRLHILNAAAQRLITGGPPPSDIDGHIYCRCGYCGCVWHQPKSRRLGWDAIIVGYENNLTVGPGWQPLATLQRGKPLVGVLMRGIASRVTEGTLKYFSLLLPYFAGITILAAIGAVLLHKPVWATAFASLGVAGSVILGAVQLRLTTRTQQLEFLFKIQEQFFFKEKLAEIRVRYVSPWLY